ncbi:LysM peptidoglycan-binding domain-containing protein [Liquorilactobacillus sicerae]|uniref:LysM peptidoglycan-binding domain-containing protein n=1 Tax=Liquorilactobacillus sicerae TaxID=1416943 RepID=UPI0024812EA9|nr:LysM peptidoglycan-binding domain-containing protein [Liquorilactobacillus sicerae]
MSRRKKNGILKKTITWIVGIFVISFIVIWGLKSRTFQSRINSFFGDNQSAQKSEYQRQRKLAHQKYGSATNAKKKSTSSSKVTDKKTTTSSADKDVASSKEYSGKTSSGSYYSSTSSSTTYRSIVVESGDTLSSIASRYGTTTSAIIRANGLSGNSISAGTTLKIPSSSTSSNSR